MKHLPVRLAVFSVLLWVATFSIQAAPTFSTLVSFAGTNGSNPAGELVLGRDGNFYGTSIQGGTNDFGAVYKLAPDWTLTAIASFNSNNGANPRGGLVQSASGGIVFYGTTAHGAGNGLGNVFRVAAGGGLSTMHDFSGADGANPEAGLTWTAGGNLAGVTYFGGTNGAPNGYGSFYTISTEGTFSSLFSFGWTNGSAPYAAMILGHDGNYYGTTQLGGSGNAGTVFRMSPSGALTVLAAFQGTNGALPLSRLAQDSDGNLYGTTGGGGSTQAGTVFRVTTNGVLSTLVSFASTNGNSPRGGLTRGSDGAFYGVTALGGATGLDLGTVFRVTTSGELSTVITFTGPNGAYPLASLAVGADGHLYGTTSKGGASDNGTVFKISIPAPVAPAILTVGELAGTIHGTYSAVAGLNYQVYYRSSLGSGNWNTLGGVVTATNSVMSFSDLIGPDAARFYRVALVWP